MREQVNYTIQHLRASSEYVQDLISCAHALLGPHLRFFPCVFFPCVFSHASSKAHSLIADGCRVHEQEKVFRREVAANVAYAFPFGVQDVQRG